MRKTLMVSFVVFLAVVLTYGLALAISGQCVNCHTMHNSQDGLPMATGGPFPQLLRIYYCVPATVNCKCQEVAQFPCEINRHVPD